MLRLTLVFGIAALFALPLRAQDASLEEAKAHAARAKVHYDLGEYEKAAEEYILVYRIRPLAPLLYNIAQSYRQAVQYEKAKQFYKSYLRETDDPKNRALIEKAIREIDELQARERRAKDGPPKGIAQDPGALAPPPTGAGTPAPPLPTVAPGLQSPATAPAAQRPPTVGPAATTPAVPAGATGTTASSGAQPASSRTVIGAGPARAPAPIAATTTATPKPAKSHTLTWVAAGASAAALAAGGLFGAKTLSSRSPDDANKANLLYAVGGGLAVVTGALLLFDF